MGIFNSYNKKKHNDLGEIIESKNELVKKILGYSISDELKGLFFDTKKIDSEGYIKYMDGLFIKNLTTEDLEKEKVSIFKIKVTKNVEVALHSHKKQSQTLFVVNGKIISLDNDMSFSEGQSFFVQKNKKHSLKYIKGTVVTVVYLPNLEKIKY